MSPLLESLKTGFESLPVASDIARGEAMAAVLADGLPLHRSERWKYTSLRALSARRFGLPDVATSIDPALLAVIPAPRAVFVNGHFDAALSQLGDLGAGIHLQPCAASTAKTDVHAVAGGSDSVFTRLNAALAQTGVQLTVEANTQGDRPLHLVFVGAAHSTDLASHLHHRISVASNARVTVVEHHLASGEHRHLHNHRVDVVLADGAELRHARQQDEASGATVITHTTAELGSAATYRRVDLELGGALSRHELDVALAGAGARLVSGGALLADGRRHVDTRLGIAHRGRDTACDLRWRGLANARGRAVFHGGILIEAGADGSDASLSNKNLLLSDQAEIDSQPVLEIHADEVKAAHGATIGRLDETALFYLRSRGIPESEARQMLIDAFLREPLALLDDAELTAMLGARLSARLAAEPR